MDAIVHRRSRAQATPKGRDLRPTERDILWFKKLNEHGPLPTPYLHAYAADTYPSERSNKNRLTELFHEGWLRRPGREYYRTRQQDFEVHANTDQTDAWLIDRQLAFRDSPGINHINYDHQRFAACVTASIELACNADPTLEFIGATELMKRARIPVLEIPCHIEHSFDTYDKETRRHQDVRCVSDRKVTPDGYFAIKQTIDGKENYWAYFLEADRITEPLHRPTLDTSSIFAKYLRYMEIIGISFYKQHLGINCGARVLFITPSRKRMESMMDLLSNYTNKQGKTYFLFKTWQDFDNRFFVPEEINYSLIRDTWERVGINRDGSPRMPISLGTI